VAKEIFGTLLTIVVWNKTNAGQGSFYRSQHEFILVLKVGDAPHCNGVELGKHGRNRSNVWTYPGVNTFSKGRMDDLAAHPTVKPVALVADAIKDCTLPGETVLDTFLGSGTTLLAAEKVGRRCLGLEIEPKFVDVGIRRWQTFTGLDAICAVTGRTSPRSKRPPSPMNRPPRPDPALRPRAHGAGFSIHFITIPEISDVKPQNWLHDPQPRLRRGPQPAAEAYAVRKGRLSQSGRAAEETALRA
jgi:hypothetical protein